MPPPGETNPEQTREPRLQLASRGPDTISKSPPQHKIDTELFLRGMEQMPPAKRQEVLDRTQQYEDGHDYDLIKTAGHSLEEMEQDPLLRHIELGGVYFTRDKNHPQLAFDVDFMNNDVAEWGVDLTDLFPANVLKVDVYDQQGNLIFENAERKQLNKKVGYYLPDGTKAEVQTGFKVVVKETQPTEGITDRKFGRKAFINGAQEKQDLLYNEGVTQVKDQAKQEAEAQGKELVLDPKTFEDMFRSLANALHSTLKKLSETGELDLTEFNATIDSLLTNNTVDEQQTELPPPDDNNPNPPASQEAPTGRVGNLVQVARQYLGSTQFRGREVAGGNLACAQVASTILKDAGYLDKVYLGVDVTEKQLLRRGWKKHRAPAKAGDVIIWGRTPSSQVNGVSRPGHKHIGIMTSPTAAVNNSSAQKMPIEKQVNFNNPRGVYFLSPPA